MAITINTPQAAQYGRTTDGTGAQRASGQWMDRMGTNDQEQWAAGQGMVDANALARGASTRDPVAQEDVGLAQREASGANGHQGNALGLAGTMAAGTAPSQAAYQLQEGLNQGLAQQTAMGRSARGGAALAVGEANAQANKANLQQNAFTQGGLLRGRDMATGRGMYGTIAGQQREQDNARLGMSNEMGQFNANQNDKFALGMGQASIGLGDVANQNAGEDLQNYQQGMNPINAQTEAEQQYRAWRAGAQKQKVANNIQE